MESDAEEGGRRDGGREAGIRYLRAMRSEALGTFSLSRSRSRSRSGSANGEGFKASKEEKRIARSEKKEGRVGV